MMIVTAVVTLAQFLLAGVVGWRLLRLPAAERFAPERLLGLYLLVGLCVGGLLVSSAYAGWSAGGTADAAQWVTTLHGIGQFVICAGYACMITFTWRTFHAGTRWAAALAAIGIASLVVSLIGRSLVEGFAITVSPGGYHWLAYLGRMLGLVWMAAASVTYWLRMRRRLALGLADAMVVNRFALWSLFAAGSIASALSEPLARLIYTWTTGGSATADDLQDVATPIIQYALIITSFSGSATVTALFLTFFPTARYERWVRRSDA